MRITLEFPEDAFLTPKTLQQVTEEVRQAAVRFWIARGELAPAVANDVTAPPSPGKNGTQGDFKAFLLSMPDEGDDSLFERQLDYGREVDLCDT